MSLYSKVLIENLINHCGEGVLVADASNNIILWNHQASRYLSELGKDISKIQNLSECFKIVGCKEITKAFKDCSVDSIHGTCSTTKPQEKFFSSEAIRIKNQDNKPSGTIVILRDITEQKKGDKLKVSFITSISHELKTPLAVMHEYLSLLNDGIAGEISQAQKAHVQIIHKNLGRLSQLVNDLVDVSRSAVSPFSIKRIPVKISDIVGDCIRSLAVRSNAKNIKVTSNIDDYSTVVYIDPQRISQVLVNLIGNAIKCTDDGGSIDVGVNVIDKKQLEAKSNKACKDLLSKESIDNFLQVKVKDTGVGIPRDEIENIFQAFYKIDITGDGGIPGGGIGLSVCKELVELHQGCIWAESDLGKGSVFEFILPVLTVKQALRQTVSDFIRKARQEFCNVLFVGVKVENIKELTRALGKDKIKGVLAIFDGLLESITRRPDDFIFGYRPDIYLMTLYDSKREGSEVLKNRIEELLSNKKLLKNSGGMKLVLKFSSFFYPDDGIMEDELFGVLSQDLKEDF